MLSDREGLRDVEPEAVCETCDGDEEVTLAEAMEACKDVRIEHPWADLDDLVPCPDCEE